MRTSRLRPESIARLRRKSAEDEEPILPNAKAHLACTRTIVDCAIVDWISAAASFASESPRAIQDCSTTSGSWLRRLRMSFEVGEIFPPLAFLSDAERFDP